MKYTGNLKENLVKMRQYFVNELGFECIDGKNLYEDKTIECELYLVHREFNVRIFIVKHIDDEEIDFTLNGRTDVTEKYFDFIDYFLNPEEITNNCEKSVIEELNEYFKEK